MKMSVAKLLESVNPQPVNLDIVAAKYGLSDRQAAFTWLQANVDCSYLAMSRNPQFAMIA